MFHKDIRAALVATTAVALSLSTIYARQQPAPAGAGQQGAPAGAAQEGAPAGAGQQGAPAGAQPPVHHPPERAGWRRPRRSTRRSGTARPRRSHRLPADLRWRQHEGLGRRPCLLARRERQPHRPDDRRESPQGEHVRHLARRRAGRLRAEARIPDERDEQRHPVPQHPAAAGHDHGSESQQTVAGNGCSRATRPTSTSPTSSPA